MPPVKGMSEASIAHTILVIDRQIPLSSLPLLHSFSFGEPRLLGVHSPGGYGVPSWFKGTVLASHSDLLDVICFDTQIGPMDSDQDASTQRACLRVDLKSAEPHE